MNPVILFLLQMSLRARPQAREDFSLRSMQLSHQGRSRCVGLPLPLDFMSHLRAEDLTPHAELTCGSPIWSWQNGMMQGQADSQRRCTVRTKSKGEQGANTYLNNLSLLSFRVPLHFHLQDLILNRKTKLSHTL